MDDARKTLFLGVALVLLGFFFPSIGKLASGGFWLQALLSRPATIIDRIIDETGTTTK